MSNKPESLVFADDRPSSLDDTLYQWAVDAEDMIREMQKHIDDLNNANSMQDKKNIENVVQEIMGLVSTHASKVHRASFIGSAKENSACRSEADKIRSKIESKLRELVENSFSVREPLSDEQRLLIWQHVSLIGVAKPSYDAWFQAGVSAAERAHNITKGS